MKAYFLFSYFFIILTPDFICLDFKYDLLLILTSNITDFCIKHFLTVREVVR